MKICSKCGVEKELRKFNKQKNGKDGVKSFCKVCESEINRENYKRRVIKEVTEECKKNNCSEIKEEEPSTKMCSKCREEKKFEEFYKHKNGKFGLRSKCKICIGNEMKDWRAKNKEKIKEYLKEYYKQNQEKLIEQRRENYRKEKGRQFLKLKEELNKIL